MEFGKFGEKVTQVSFHIFRLIAWFSKYDFWNLWKILDWHGGSENFRDLFFEMKTFSQNIFFGILLKMFEFFWKIFKFYKDFLKKPVFETLTFLTNPYRILRFSKKTFFWKIYIFGENFLVSKINIFGNIFFTMSIQNFPKIPKITLRNPCDAP